MFPRGRSFDNFSIGYQTTHKQPLISPFRRTNLGARNAQETNRHEHPSNSNLIVAELDTVQVLYTKTVGRDETVEREDLVHLDGCYKCASALADDVGD